MWISLEEFAKKKIEGLCWIAYKGKVQSAYADPYGILRHHKHSTGCHLRECITGVQVIDKPKMPVHPI